MFSTLFNGRNKKILSAANDASPDSIVTLNKILQDRFINVDTRDHDSSYTPLMWAVFHGQLNKILLLLKHGANPYWTTKGGDNLLHIAIRQKHMDIYCFLAEYFPELCYLKGEEGKTPNEIKQIRNQLNNRFLLEKTILEAVKSSSEESIDRLIDALKYDSVNVNVRDVFDQHADSPHFLFTPLMWAVQLNQLEKVILLLQYKADPYQKTKEGNTVLHIAAREGHEGVYCYLAERFPDLRYQVGDKKQTPDQVAEMHQQVNIIHRNKTHFSNAFFGSLKTSFPDELAVIVASFVQDTEDMESLSMVNKAWHQLLKAPYLKENVNKYVKRFLPQNLQSATWQQIINHYYPGTLKQEQSRDEFLLMKQFIRKVSTFYVMNDKSITLLRFGCSHEREHKHEFRYRENYYSEPVTNEDILCTAQQFFKDIWIHQRSITAYKSLTIIHKEECKINRYHNTMEFWKSLRTETNPIYEVTIQPSLALSLLNEEIMVRLHPHSLISVKRGYLTNVFFNLCPIEPIQFSVKECINERSILENNTTSLLYSASIAHSC